MQINYNETVNDTIDITFINGGVNITSELIFEKFAIKNYIIIGLYIPVFLLALTANILVIAIVIKYHYMRNVTNYFLVNLSVADLLVTLVCMPDAMWNSYTLVWYFGDITCKVTKYLQCISVASSVFTITAMAVDRYLSTTRPFGFFSRCFNKRTTIMVIVILWMTSMLLFAPILIVAQVVDSVNLENITLNICIENWNKKFISRDIFGVICFIAMFAVPGFIMLWAYSMMGKKLCSFIPPFDNDEGSASTQQSSRLVRERRRLAWILLLLALVFACCWLPYNVINLLVDTEKMGSGQTVTDVRPYMLLLGHANSALNPVIYCIMSKNFRRSVKELMRSLTTKRRPNQNIADSCGRMIEYVPTHRCCQISHKKWVDSSASSQRLYLQRLKSLQAANNHYTTSRLHSSQKTTKTCAV